MREAAPPARSLVLALVLAWIGVLAQLDVSAQPGPALDGRWLEGSSVEQPGGPGGSPALADAPPPWTLALARTDGEKSGGTRTGRRPTVPTSDFLPAAGTAAAPSPPEPPAARSDLGSSLLGLPSVPANAPPRA